VTPARAYQTGAGEVALGVAVCDARLSPRADPALERETNKSSKTIGERAALGSAHRGASRKHRQSTFLGVAVWDARPRVPDRRHRQNVINDGIFPPRSPCRICCLIMYVCHHDVVVSVVDRVERFRLTLRFFGVSTAAGFIFFNSDFTVCVIAVSKSHELFVESSSTFLIFFDNDAYAFTSTPLCLPKVTFPPRSPCRICRLIKYDLSPRRVSVHRRSRRAF